ncbi:MAG: HAD family hydrolase [Candidatus Staskawiczbacteria bacterium]|jgi:HAD superfamily hydrolase (TIGR01484 family)
MAKKFGVFLDIDGCLTSSNGNVCLEYYEANSELASMVADAHIGKGPSIRLCSGRDIHSVELMSNFFGMVNVWMIAELGAVLFNPTTYEVKLNPAITDEMQEAFHWLKRDGIPVILEKFPSLQEYSGYKICSSLQRPPDSAVDLDEVRRFLTGVRKPGIKRRNNTWKRKPKRIPGLLTKFIKEWKMYVRQSGDFVDILPYDVRKGTAAKSLMEKEGWDSDTCIAIGDSESDFSLFRSVGRIGCPSNATQGCIKFVQERRGMVSPYPYTRGVVHVIKRWLGQEDLG